MFCSPRVKNGECISVFNNNNRKCENKEGGGSNMYEVQENTKVINCHSTCSVGSS